MPKNTIKIPGLRLGIVGGGQLGRMMAIEARRLGIITTILDPHPNPPARGIADASLQGSLYDPDALQKLADCSDIITYEIEHIDSRVLANLESQGHILRPSAKALGLIQDKGLQKRFLQEQGIPVPHLDLVSQDQVSTWEAPGYPIVQKLRKGGYDGRGVVLLHSKDDPRLQGDSIFEEAIDIALELAVLIARDPHGSMVVYPVIEMIFDPHAQICSSVLAPARITSFQELEAIAMAKAAVEAVDIVGVVAVELFLDTRGRILVNELAPRPHNSGHWTIEGAVTNQFEQHVRAVCGLPLGSVELLRPSAMVNLLGAPGARGRPGLLGLDLALAIPGFKLHWYQKDQVAPLRKMGHGTVIAASVDLALTSALKAQELIRVIGEESSMAD